MEGTKRKIVRWDLTIKFIILFAFGMLLALGFANLVSYSAKPGDAAQLSNQLAVFGIVTPFYVKPTYLSLTVAGTLGGLLYSMLIDQTLEFPSWAKDDAGLKPGFIGDIFVGISGAFIAYIALPDPLIDSNGYSDSSILVFVAGLVGGYGGKYVLDAALKRLIQRIEDTDVIEEKLAQINEIEDLQRLANKQIFEGLNLEELTHLQTQLQADSLDPKVKERIFNLARESRRLGSRVKSYEARVARSIPILEALLQSDDTNDAYHAQLACAYRDTVPPRLDLAISEFNRAIELRQPNGANNWRYEMDRTVALIRKVVQDGAENNTQLRDQILQDLRTINCNYSLEKIFLDFDKKIVIPIENWLAQNQAWLQQHSDGKELLEQLTQMPSLRVPLSPAPPESAPEAAPPSTFPEVARNGSSSQPALSEPLNGIGQVSSSSEQDALEVAHPPMPSDPAQDGSGSKPKPSEQSSPMGQGTSLPEPQGDDFSRLAQQAIRSSPIDSIQDGSRSQQPQPFPPGLIQNGSNSQQQKPPEQATLLDQEQSLIPLSDQSQDEFKKLAMKAGASDLTLKSGRTQQHESSSQIVPQEPDEVLSTSPDQSQDEFKQLAMRVN